MRLDEIIQQHIQSLLPAQQAEVFDFVLFLEQKQAKHELIKNHQAVDKRRQPPVSIAGKGKIIGDLTD